MTKESIKKSLHFSMWDAVFASCMTGFTQDFFTPFILLLGGGASAVALLSALPNLIASLVQLATTPAVEKTGSRKIIITSFVMLQAIILLVMAILIIGGLHSVWAAIVLVVLFTAAGAFTMPAWGSMMSELVNEERRGEFFGTRNQIIRMVTLVFTLGAGVIIDRFTKINTAWGFAILFGFSFLFRVISWYFLTKMHDPPYTIENRNTLSVKSLKHIFLKRNENSYIRFVIFVTVLYFTVYIASPFFSVLMLRDLHYSYTLYSTNAICGQIFSLLFIRRWGILGDKIGNVRIMRYTAVIISVIPLCWVINQNTYYLFIIQAMAGVAWAGFTIASSNFIFDICAPQKRSRYIAYFNVVTGTSICLGSLTGGLLMHFVPPLLGHTTLMVIFISFTLRVVVAFFMPLRLQEPKEVVPMNFANVVWELFTTRTRYSFNFSEEKNKKT